MSTNQKLIHEDVNQNETENVANRVRTEQVKVFSKQVNEKTRSYKDALVRSNYGTHNSILS